MDFGQLVSGVGGVLTGLSSIANVGINALNYKQQKEQQRYDRQMQQVMMLREDNAVQRRVADLKSAGLSPVLAAGSAAGSGPVYASSAPRMQAMPDMSNIAKVVMSMLKQDKQIDQTAQSTELMKATMEKTLSDLEINQYNKLRIAAETDRTLAETDRTLNSTKLLQSQTYSQYLENRAREIDLRNQSKSGLSRDASKYGKMYRDIISVGTNYIEGIQNLKRAAKDEQSRRTSGGW